MWLIFDQCVAAAEPCVDVWRCFEQLNCSCSSTDGVFQTGSEGNFHLSPTVLTSGLFCVPKPNHQYKCCHEFIWQLVSRANTVPLLCLRLLGPAKDHDLAVNSWFDHNKQGWIFSHCLLKNVQLCHPNINTTLPEICRRRVQRCRSLTV